MNRLEEDAAARGYAESLFGLAKIEDLVDQLEDEVFELKKTLEENFKLREFLWDREIPGERKKELLAEILGPQVSKLLRNGLAILIDQNRTHLATQVAEHVLDLVKGEKNRLLAEVITAVPLTPELEAKVKKRLSEITGKQVAVKNTIDGDILGGMVIRVEGKVLNLSIQRRLTDLKRDMEVA